MLKTTLLIENLKNGLTYAYHAVSSRSQLPILLNFHLAARNGNVFVSSTDLEVGIRIKIPARVDGEGETTVSAKTFLDLISSISQEKIELLVKDKTLELVGQGIKTTFPTIPAAEFPKLYEEKGEKRGEFKKEDFIKEASRIVFSASSDLGRPALSGVLLKNEDGGLTMVSTDGYRLSLKRGFAKNSEMGENEEIKLLIPAKVIREILGLKEENALIKLFVSEKSNQVLFETEEVELIGRLIEAEYPQYQKIIPVDFSTSAVFDKNDAQNAVRSCSVFAREAANIIKMSIGKNKVAFSAQASSAGENEIEIEAKTIGEENEIAFNSRYLMEFFGNIEAEEVVFEMTGPLNPGVFKLGGDKDYLHLIMPIRVQE